jgi:hypothetical protein
VRDQTAAEAWVREQKAVYPNASPDALARLAVKELGRRSRLARILRWNKPTTDLVLRIAAAYGKTPTADEIEELAHGPRSAERAIARFRAS